MISQLWSPATCPPAYDFSRSNLSAYVTLVISSLVKNISVISQSFPIWFLYIYIYTHTHIDTQTQILYSSAQSHRSVSVDTLLLHHTLWVAAALSLLPSTFHNSFSALSFVYHFSLERGGGEREGKAMEPNSASKLGFFMGLFLLLGFQLVHCAVTYDRKAIVINGQRRILISGSIHYPRSTPEVTQRFLPIFPLAISQIFHFFQQFFHYCPFKFSGFFLYLIWEM